MIGIAKSGINFHIATITDGSLIFEPNLSLDTVESLLGYLTGDDAIRFYSPSRDGWKDFKIRFPALAIKFVQPKQAEVMDALSHISQSISDGKLTASIEVKRLIDGILLQVASMTFDMVSRESGLYSDKELHSTAIYLAFMRESGDGKPHLLTESQLSNNDQWGRKHGS